MNVRIGDAIPFSAVYQDSSGDGVEGLTVTVDVFNSLGIQVVTDAAATETGGGGYSYTLASGANAAEGLYRALFKTTDVTVIQQHKPDKALSQYSELVLPDGVEEGYTLQNILRGMASVLCGKVSGLPFAPVFRDLNDSQNRVSGTSDADGNRSAITLNLD